MSKLSELQLLSKGFMAQKHELKEKNEQISDLRGTQELVTGLQVQGGADIQSFIASARVKMTSLTKQVETVEVERNALQRSMASLSVELSNAQKANASMVEENTKLRELVAQSKGDMYEMLHNESKDNLTELATLRSENIGLQAEVAKLEREVADAKVLAEQVPALQDAVSQKDKELDTSTARVRQLEKENKLYRAQNTTEVHEGGDDGMLLN